MLCHHPIVSHNYGVEENGITKYGGRGGLTDENAFEFWHVLSVARNTYVGPRKLVVSPEPPLYYTISMWGCSPNSRLSELVTEMLTAQGLADKVVRNPGASD
jgi:hypothetical protein